MFSWEKLVPIPVKSVFSTCHTVIPEAGPWRVPGLPREELDAIIPFSALAYSAHGAWAVPCLSVCFCKLGKPQGEKCLVPLACPPLRPLGWVMRHPDAKPYLGAGLPRGMGPTVLPSGPEGSLQEVTGGRVGFRSSLGWGEVGAAM